LGIQVVAVKELVPENVVMIPTGRFVVKDSDVLVLLGPENALAGLKEHHPIEKPARCMPPHQEQWRGIGWFHAIHGLSPCPPDLHILDVNESLAWRKWNRRTLKAESAGPAGKKTELRFPFSQMGAR
jgi:hypothetical protein